MVLNTIERIEEKIRTNNALSAKNKIELLELLSSLKPEMEKLLEDRKEHAESISGFMERSTHEVFRHEKNPALIKYAINGLSASVKGFEESHPQLVKDVNYIAIALANMGI